MAVTINSSTTSGAIITSDNTGITAIQANNVTSLTADGTGRLVLPSISLPTATAGDLGYNGTALYFTPAGTQRGVIPGQQMFALNTTVTGLNSTANQSMFGLSSGVTLASSTTYAFEILLSMSKSAGTTPHSIQFLFGGAATLNGINYCFIRNTSTISFTDVSAYQTLGGYIQTASATTVQLNSSSSAVYQTFILKGTVSINVGGTFHPQYSLSAAPGGAYTTAAGSYMLIYPVATGSSNVSIGTWA